MSVCVSVLFPPATTVRLRGKEGFLPLSIPARVRTYTRAYIRGYELCSYVGERDERAGEKDGERKRRKERENAEEVEGRLASIRERDADRVGESWVRSHKEVDTRRHLNPPRPPSLPPSFLPTQHTPSPSHPTRRRPPLVPPSAPPYRLSTANLRPPSSNTLGLSVSPSLARFALHPSCILLLFLPFCRPPSLFSLFWRSLRASLPSLAEPTPEAEARS